MSQKNTERLITRYSRLIIEQSEEELPFVRLRELLEERDGSLKPFLEELEKKTDSAAHQFALAKLLLLDRQTKRALALLQRLLDERPESARLWNLSALAKRIEGDLEGALSDLESSLPRISQRKRGIQLREMRELALDLNRIQQAQKFQAQLVKLEPTHYFLLTELAASLQRRGDSTQSLQQYLALESSINPKHLPFLYRDIAQLSLLKGDIEGAGQYLAKAQALAPESLKSELAPLFVDYYRKTDRLHEHVSTLKLRAKTTRQWQEVGEILSELGRPSEAEGAYQKAITLDPAAVDARLALINLLELRGDLQAATAQYDAVVKQRPDDITLTLDALELYHAAGELERARERMGKARRKFRTHADELLLLLDSAERFSMRLEVKAIEQQLERLHDGNYQVLIELGERAYASGQEEKAFVLFSKARDRHPIPREGLRLYIRILLDHHKSQDAIDLAKELLQRSPRERWLQELLARAYARAAATSLKSQRDLYNQEAESLWLALLYAPTADLQSVKEREAQRQLLRIWSEQEELSAQINELAAPWFQKIDRKKIGPREASDKPALQLKLDLVTAKKLRLAAAGLSRLGRSEEANQLLQVLISNRSADRATLNMILKMHEKSQNLPAAIQILENLCTVNPSREADYLEQISQLYRKLGQEERALQYALAAVAKSPKKARAYAELGDLYLNSNSESKAVEAYRKSLKSYFQEKRTQSSNSEAMAIAYKLARILAQKKNEAEAISLYLTILRKSQSEPMQLKASLAALAIAHGSLRKLENHLRPLVSAKSSSKEMKRTFLHLLEREIDEVEYEQQKGSLPLVEAEKIKSEIIDRSLSILLPFLKSNSEALVSQSLELLRHGKSTECQLSLLNLALSKGITSTTLKQRRLALWMMGSRTEKGEGVNLNELAESPFALGQLNTHSAWLLARFYQLDPSLESFGAARKFLQRSSSDANLYLILLLSATRGAEAESLALKRQILQLFFELLAKNNPRLQAAIFYALSAQSVHGQNSTDLEQRLHESGLSRSKDPLVVKLASLASLRFSLEPNALNPPALHKLSISKPPGLRQASLRILKGEEIFSLPFGIALSLEGPESWVQNAGNEPLPLTERIALFGKWQEQLRDEILAALHDERLSSEQLISSLLSANGQTIAAPFILGGERSPAAQELVAALHQSLQKELLAKVLQGTGRLYLASMALLDVNQKTGLEVLEQKVASAEKLSDPELQALLLALSRAQSPPGQNLLYQFAENAHVHWSLRRRALMALKSELFPAQTDAPLCRRLRSLEQDPSLVVAQKAKQIATQMPCPQQLEAAK